MSASLVGSEMCIRDRSFWRHGRVASVCCLCRSQVLRRGRCSPASRAPVSYTHLTLPTICSV
eukprot:1824720-Alexandrium_andersonii.AAC.1